MLVLKTCHNSYSYYRIYVKVSFIEPLEEIRIFKTKKKLDILNAV